MSAWPAKKPDRHLLALGNAIRLRRERLALSQEAFAERIKASPLFVNRLESGQQEPRIFALSACAQVFGISVGELMESVRTETEPLLLYPSACEEQHQQQP